ncbi:hypothetical protein AB0J80_06240 [Actinoplanes sp. NPDC049548]|uniref:hypothetical protein n=1 Tax=Actinoplanes sp. NPDC049548 TaxID=3155152 RepID=UPI003432D227
MIEDGLDLVRPLLGSLPPQWQTVLALPLLVAALLLIANLVAKSAPALDHIVRPVVAAATSATGLLLLVPEYLVTVVIRRAGRRPPAALHLYDDGVEGLVGLGMRASRTGLSGLTTDRRLRRLLVVVVVGATLVVSNGSSCADASTPSCRKPVASWWEQTTRLVSDDEKPPAVKHKPAKNSKPTKATAK